MLGTLRRSVAAAALLLSGVGAALTVGTGLSVLAGSSTPAQAQSSWTAVEVASPSNATANPDGFFRGVTCVSAGNCVGVGTYDSSFSMMAATETNGAWAQATEVAPPADAAATNPSPVLDSASCTSVGNCVGVGAYKNTAGNNAALIATETGGIWGQAIAAVLPSDAGASPAVLSGVSCTSAGNCLAMGNYRDSTGKQQAMMDVESSGTWAQAIKVPSPSNADTANPQGFLGPVSCTSAGNCTAAGDYRDSANFEQGMAATETGGTWGPTVEVTAPAGAAANPRLALLGVSCWSAGNCSAAGQYTDSSNNSESVVAAENGGSWTQAVEIAPPSNDQLHPVDSGLGGIGSTISCWSAGSCVAAGGYIDSAGHWQNSVATETDGTWSPQQEELPVPSNAAANPDGGFAGVACPSAGSCTAVGNYIDSSGNTQLEAVDESAGCGTGFILQPDNITCVASFAETDTVQTVDVPAGVTAVTVTADGAQGQNVAEDGGGVGGLGGTESGIVPVNGGDQLDVIVGGTDGYGGGGTASTDGGGGSFVFDGPSDSETLLVAAGGGGGGGLGAEYSDDGGNGGGLTGGQGSFSTGSDPATGGTQSAGGQAGYYQGSPGDCEATPGESDGTGPATSDSALGLGGSDDSHGDQFGGGGGGYYGGGAGCNDGTSQDSGAGGSGFLIGTAFGTSSGVASAGGNGSVTISYVMPILDTVKIGAKSGRTGVPATGAGPGIVICGKGFTAGGTSLVTGVFFGTSAAKMSAPTTKVTAGGCTTTPGDDSITLLAPPSPGGYSQTVDVTVTTSGGTSPLNPPADEITYLPSVSASSPEVGPMGGGSVTLTGAGFEDGSGHVVVSALAAKLVTPNLSETVTTFHVTSPTTMTATIPAWTASTPTARITAHLIPSTSSATGYSVDGGVFTYVPAPTVTRVAPARAQGATPRSIVVYGTNLLGASVNIGSFSTTVLKNTNEAVVVTTPSDSTEFDTSLLVTTAGGSATGTFDLYPQPTIAGISPDSGAAGGAHVTISGTWFSSSSPLSTYGLSVTVGGLRAPAVSLTGTAGSTEQLVVLLPNEPSGTYPVVVKSTFGGASAPFDITY